MKNYKKLSAVLLCLVLLLAVLPAGAAAAGAGTETTAPQTSAKPEKAEAGDAQEAEKAQEPEKKEEEKAEPAKKDGAEDNVPADKKPLICAEGETLYAAEGDTVFNNGGTVYNNGGLVYNNGGLVYNNLGIAYNNGGTVYGNGGTVYNNGGTVYNNGSEIISHGDSGEIKAEDGLFTVELTGSYEGAVEIQHMDGEDRLSLSSDDECRIRALEGYEISYAEVSSGSLSLESDGSYILRDVEADATLRLECRIPAPELSLRSGVYLEPQKLKISGPEDAEIYYSLDGSEPDEESEKYSGSLKLSEGCTIKAIAVTESGIRSEVSEISLNILEIVVPGFAPVKEGYEAPEPQPITVKNPGSLDAEIKSMTLSGEDAGSFTISHTAGERIPAGETQDSFWTLVPAQGLKKGSYEATLTIKFASGEDAQYELIFNVK